MAKQKLCVINGEFHRFTFQHINLDSQFVQACECGHIIISPLTRESKRALDDSGIQRVDAPQIPR